MRSRYGFREAGAAHFITGTVVSWLPVFTTAARCDILVESLKFSREKKGLKIYAWAILDNHFHAIVDGPDLSRVVMELKRYTAHRMIEQLEQERCAWLLHLLASERAKHKRGEPAPVLAGGIASPGDDRRCHDGAEAGLHSPKPRRARAGRGAEHWRYSSAHEWLTGASPVMTCDRWR